MQNSNFSINRFLLFFLNQETESKYIDCVLNRTILYCRIAWGLIILLGLVFAFLDPVVFGEKGTFVTSVRMTLLIFASVVILATFHPKMSGFMALSSALFVLSTGSFCIFLIAIDHVANFSPYFTGLFYALAGVFSTVGLGFRYSLFSLFLIFFIFEIVFGLFIPIPLLTFILYSLFLSGMMLIVGFISFMVEKISRQNFISNEELRESLDQVKTLSGLIPICSHCNKMRDDKGFWNRLEEYINAHSEATLSHGICPECLEQLHPDFYNKMKGKLF